MASRLAIVAAAALALPALDAAGARADDDGVVVQDLAYGEVLFEFFQEDYFAALTRLLAAQKRGELEHHGPEAELMLGGIGFLLLLAGALIEHFVAVEDEERDVVRRLDAICARLDALDASLVAHGLEDVDAGGPPRGHGGADDADDDGEHEEEHELAGRQ